MNRCLPYFFLTAAVFAVYANIYENVLLFDDDLLIHLNTYLRSWDMFGKLLTASTTEGAHIAGGFYRPIQNILYFIVFQIFGEDVVGFHLLNVSLHAANACLGYRLAVKLGIDARAALIAMLLWALHPLHTEAITYMSGTAEPLFVMFGLGGLNVIFRTPNPNVIQIARSLPLFALAILSKETAVVFPALACVCWYFSSERRWNIKTYLPTWPLWVVALAYLSWRVTSTHFDGPERYAMLFHLPEYAKLQYYAQDPFVRILTFIATLPYYAGLLLWPDDLYMERGFALYDDLLAWPVLLGAAMLVATALQILFNKTKHGRSLSWGLLWFFASHAPNTGILFPMNSLFLEHWMYLPTIGLFLGIADSVTPLVTRTSWLHYTALGSAMIAITALSARTYEQNKIWREPIAFYNNIFDHGVSSPRARNNLAIAYTNNHDLPKAIEEYRRAIKEGDTYAETHFNLALALLQLPDQKAQIPAAIAELERSLVIEPRFYRSYIKKQLPMPIKPTRFWGIKIWRQRVALLSPRPPRALPTPVSIIPRLMRVGWLNMRLGKTNFWMMLRFAKLMISSRAARSMSRSRAS